MHHTVRWWWHWHFTTLGTLHLGCDEKLLHGDYTPHSISSISTLFSPQTTTFSLDFFKTNDQKIKLTKLFFYDSINSPTILTFTLTTFSIIFSHKFIETQCHHHRMMIYLLIQISSLRIRARIQNDIVF